MKSSFFLPMAVVALLASCSSDMELEQSGKKFDGRVLLSAPAYEYEDGTRTSLTSSDKGIEFAWDNDETIGIFPVAPTTNNQAKQMLNDGSSNGTTSSFDGAGWALLRGNTYVAYYPYQTEVYEDYTAIPIDMTGQTQDGNGSVAHIGAGYDYMYATATVPKNGNVNFDFNHVVSIIKLELEMPVAAEWKSVTLSSDEDVFVTKATMNSLTGDIAAVEKKSSVSLNLSNVSTTTENEKLELYIAVLPTKINASIEISVLSSDYDYSSSVDAKFFNAGKAYMWKVNQWEETIIPSTPYSGDGFENGHAYVDLGLSVKWATLNIGATSISDRGSEYFSWGETSPKKTNGYSYWSSYAWSSGETGIMMKYCSNKYSSYYDNRKVLELKDDAAHVNWWGNWRMPTYEEQLELVNNCYWVWTKSYNNIGGYGYIVYKAKSIADKGQFVYDGMVASNLYSLSDSHIFLPVTVIKSGDKYLILGSPKANYWSSSLEENNDEDREAKLLYFDSGNIELFGEYRYEKCYVRAVCE